MGEHSASEVVDVYVKDNSGNKAKVIITDVKTSNGVIHAIDTVVIPQ